MFSHNVQYGKMDVFFEITPPLAPMDIINAGIR